MRGTRRLIYIPAVHNRVDCGVDQPPDPSEELLSPEVKKHRELQRSIPDAGWQRIEIYWDAIEEAFSRLDIAEWGHVKVFSDSIITASQALIEKLKSLAAQGSRHSRLIFRMIDRGASLEATENAEALIDFGLFHDEALMAVRDRAIAVHINAGLQPGETAVLILGAAHYHWTKYLDADIEIECLLTDADFKALEKRVEAVATPEPEKKFTVASIKACVRLVFVTRRLALSNKIIRAVLWRLFVIFGALFLFWFSIAR